MRQIFFIKPVNAPEPKVTVGGHYWTGDGVQAVGVLELAGNVDAEAVIDALEAAGIMWLPNHMQPNSELQPEHVDALAQYGVQAGHTTAEAMTAVYAKSGFAPHKPKRF